MCSRCFRFRRTTHLVSIRVERPAAGILVRLFNSGPTTSSDSTSSDLDGLSTVTDEFGNYSFENLSTGTYRVDPDLIGFTFEPAEVTLDAGIPSPDIEAIPIPGPTDQCTRVNKASVIAEADTNARALSDIGLQLSSDYMAIAKNRLNAPRRGYFVKSLRSALLKVRRSLQNLLSQSQTLPTVKFVCPKEASCSKKRYAQAVAKYRLNVTNIRKLDFFILRTAKEFFARSVGPNRRVAAKRVLTIHRRAIAAVKSFPLESFDCGQ